MLRKIAFGTVLAVLAQSAAAEEKLVFITENGFFPEIIYMDDGDTLTFVNDDNEAHKISGEDGEWETTVVNVAQSQSITVWQGMKNRYYSDRPDHDSGVITFAPDPQ